MSSTAEVVSTLLTLRAFIQPEASVVRCAGALTMATSALLKTYVQGALPETKRIILDLTNLARMDSAGLGAIVGLYISARHAGRTLEIINLSPGLRELFKLTNLLSIFEPCACAPML
ncbi:MAG TPA: STAS domain-containing protein [Candidatus Cybelea sp.]|nr:STAS domain-containing protein [Candidatus Cybelea sp.]